MKLVFPSASSWTAAVPEAPISLDYGTRYNVTLDCEAQDGTAMDAEALGMRQWKAQAVSAVNEGTVLAEWPVPQPVGSTFSLSLGVYAPALYEYLAGRENMAAMMHLNGYGVDGSEATLEVSIQFPILLQCEGNTKCAMDLHKVLLEELAYAVDAAQQAAVTAQAYIENIPDVDSKLNSAVQIIEGYVDDALAQVEGFADQTASQAAAASGHETEARAQVSSAYALVRDAQWTTEGTDEQASSVGLEKSARGWYLATLDKAQSASSDATIASSAARVAASAASSIPNMSRTQMTMESMDDFTSKLGSQMHGTFARQWDELHRKWTFTFTQQ
jgi:hypothetical protein